MKFCISIYLKLSVICFYIFFYKTKYDKIIGTLLGKTDRHIPANSVVPGWTQQNAACNQGLHYSTDVLDTSIGSRTDSDTF